VPVFLLRKSGQERHWSPAIPLSSGTPDVLSSGLNNNEQQ